MTQYSYTQNWRGLGPEMSESTSKGLEKSELLCMLEVAKPPTHAGVSSHVAIHMLTTHRIRFSLSLQVPFSLLASPSLRDFLLAPGRHHPRPWSRDTQGLVPLFAPASILLGVDPDATLRQMGCASLGRPKMPFLG
jgi:hypothetical protein